MTNSKRPDGKTSGVKRPLVLALLLLLSLSGCDQGKNKAAPPRPAQPVVTAKAVKGDSPLIIEAIGTVKSMAHVVIRSRVTGHIKKVHFKRGDNVKAGQLLFTIDPVPFRLALDEAKANLASAKATADQAGRKAKRLVSLLKGRSVSQEAADEATADAQSAQANVAKYRAAAAIAQQNLDYCTIAAPISGRTGDLLMDEGNLVKENDDQLIVLDQVEPIRVRFSVAQKYLPQVKQYRDLSLLKVEATIPGDANGPETGQLKFVDNQINPQTGMIDLLARFDNVNRRLWPGQFVSINLYLKVDHNVILVPKEAVQNGPKGLYVYVVKNGDAAEYRPVKQGRLSDHLAVINSGVKAGETVVIEGQIRLRPGAKVKIRSGEQPAGKAKSG